MSEEATEGKNQKEILSEMKITFTYRDEFKRKTIAENIIKLLNSETQISPIIIDAPWGSGKSEFCFKLINLIEEKKPKEKDGVNFKALYFDTYTYDHSDDPFLMLIAGILNSTKGKEKTNLAKKVIPVLKVFSKAAGNAAVSAAVSHFFKLNLDLDSISKKITKNSDGNSMSILNAFEKIEENSNILKEHLKEITKKEKIVIFIDELDRCKPTFALSLLEKVKHVFDVPGIQFVFSTNMEQLCCIVKKQYGSEINAENYLSKFFKYTIKLSDNHSLNYYNDQHNGFTIFKNSLAKLPDFKEFINHKPIEEFILHLFKNDKRSLRDAEMYFDNIKMFNALDSNISKSPYSLFLFLSIISIYIYTFYSDFTNKILSDVFKKEDVLKFLGNQAKIIGKPEDSCYIDILYTLFIINLPGGNSEFITDDEIKNFKEIYKSFTRNMPRSSTGDALLKIKNTLRTMQFEN